MIWKFLGLEKGGGSSMLSKLRDALKQDYNDLRIKYNALLVDKTKRDLDDGVPQLARSTSPPARQTRCISFIHLPAKDRSGPLTVDIS